jgi:hypothetical protein
LDKDPLNALFNEKTIKRMCSGITLTKSQEENAMSWVGLIKSGKLQDEVQNYPQFAIFVLEGILGFPIRDEWKLNRGNIEFSFRDPTGQSGVGIEAKGMSVKDLFAPQHREKREHETPIKQTWDYMGNGNFDYGVCTNYRYFVLIDKSKGYSKYHFFDFQEIENDREKLKEFVGIFSKRSLIDSKFISELYRESVLEEKEFTKHFYKLFHETRLMLIKEFQDNRDVHKDDAIRYAQVFLNRIVFALFLEDTGKMRKRVVTESIINSLNPFIVNKTSKLVSDTLIGLFERLDKGAEKPIEIFGFNGGLFNEEIPIKIYFNDLREAYFFNDVFQNSKLRNIRLDENCQKVIQEYSDLNPLIINILRMASFDFRSDLNVNILGHIFEQSLADLEELKEPEKDSKKKKEGVFYTPEYVTDIICRNTIISSLSAKGNDTIDDLIDEYHTTIDELEEKFKKLKILDPACGSGAFLLKAVDILLEIHKRIQIVKETKGEYAIIKNSKKDGKVEQYTLAKWHEEEEARRIIENNIFGVDINQESVEITKLSLFLRIASGNRKLMDLSSNIKLGNSIIDDPSVDPIAFQWKKEFSNVPEGKFDIIIGNPPYVRVQNINHKMIDWLKANKRTAYKRVDISLLFFELAKDLIKPNGKVSFITSNQFLVSEYGRKARSFILSEFKIIRIIDFGDLPLFEDASTYVSIFFLENSFPSNFELVRVKELDTVRNLDYSKSIRIDISKLNESSWTLEDTPVLEILDKMKTHKTVKDLGGAWGGIITGSDEVYLLNKETAEKNKIEPTLLLPIIRGSDPQRYSEFKTENFVLYPYVLNNEETLIIPEDELSQKFPHGYRYLLAYKAKLQERKDSRKNLENKKNWYGLIRFSQLDMFRKIKIITPGEVREHKFCLDFSGSGYSFARVYSIIVDDKEYDIKYVLGMLNSDVVKFFLRNNAPHKRGGYYTYSSVFLDKVPIPMCSYQVQQSIIIKVEELIKMHTEKNNRIETFLQRLKGNFGLRDVSKKFQLFFRLESNEFLNEIKILKVKLSLEDQDDWEKYFDNYKSSILQLEKQIMSRENEVNELAFQVYEISSNERNVILQFLENT